MRYYKIIISDPTSGQVLAPPGFSSAMLGGATYTSFVNGQTLPAAWDIELDIPVIDAATSQGFAFVRIWGVSLAEISQSNNLIGKNIQVFGGMQKGLPLANPAQAGMLTSGTIYQAFGNWEGTEMTLDIVITPGAANSQNTNGGVGTLKNPKNFTLNWQGGQPISNAIQSALQTAFPGYTVNVNVNQGIVRPAGDSPIGFYSTLEQFAQAVRSMSQSIIKTTGYPGISIVPNGTTIDVFDGTTSRGQSLAINFTDLIGQPTWIQSPNITAKVVMRSDLKVGQQFTLPQTQITNTQAANSNLVNQKVSFQGGFTCVSLRHVGHYRQATGDSWVTVLEGAPNQVS